MGRRKVGGANAPPTTITKPRKRGLGRVFVALGWRGGHTQMVGLPGLLIRLYLLLVFSFQLQNLTKQSLIVGFNRLIWEDSFQLIFNLSDMPRFALIPWFRIYSELN